MATPYLAFPHIASNQASKEVTANETFDDICTALCALGGNNFSSFSGTYAVTAEQFASAMLFVFTGSLSADSTVTVPVLNTESTAMARPFVVVNQTTGGFKLTVKTPAGSGVAVRAYDGYVFLYNDGTNVVRIADAPLKVQKEYTAQAAPISADTVYSVPTGKSGLYRVSWAAKITTVDSTSSTLGGAGGFQVTYTDADDSVSLTPLAVPNATATGNTTATQLSGSVEVNAKAGSDIQVSFGFTAGTGDMRYSLHVRVEAL